jgi:hypothetical protein
MADIPSQLSFEHMLSHLFPGFFTALTVFMILDILSPLDITSVILKDFNALMGFFGFIFLAGTILGVIIDGIHHRVIELGYFHELEKDEFRHQSLNKDECTPISTYLIANHILSQIGCDKSRCKRLSDCYIHKAREYELLKLFLVFKKDEADNCIAFYDYLKKSVYYYYEFYANASIALFLFAFIAPIYMVKRFDIDFNYAVISGVVIIVMSVACFDFALMAYRRWISILYFSYCKCLNGNNPDKSFPEIS